MIAFIFGDLSIRNKYAVENSILFFTWVRIISPYAKPALFILRAYRTIGVCAWTLPVPGMFYQYIALL